MRQASVSSIAPRTPAAAVAAATAAGDCARQSLPLLHHLLIFLLVNLQVRHNDHTKHHKPYHHPIRRLQEGQNVESLTLLVVCDLGDRSHAQRVHHAWRAYGFGYGGDVSAVFLNDFDLHGGNGRLIVSRNQETLSATAVLVAFKAQGDDFSWRIRVQKYSPLGT